MEDFSGALAHTERALAIYREFFPPDHPHIAISLGNTAFLHAHRGRPEYAETALLAANAVARRSQTNCSGPSCIRKLREDGAPLDVCVKCRRTFYCGKACQTADWKREGGHRAECKALIAEGKVAEGPPVAQYRVPVGEFIP